MSADGVAYRTTAAEVLAAWAEYKERLDKIREARDAMSARYGGRRLMVNHSGFGHGTRVVGFEVFDGEPDGLVIGDNGELRIPKKGPPYNTATPNLRRKAGKDLSAELATLTDDGPELVGMPAWTLVGLRVLKPGVLEHEGALWVRWADDIEGDRPGETTPGGAVDHTLWSREPLSAFYAAREAQEADQ